VVLVRRPKEKAYTTSELEEEKRNLMYVARHCNLYGSLTDRIPVIELMRMEKYWNDPDSGKLKYWQKSMYQRHIIHHKYHITLSVIAQLRKSKSLIY
jgi:hypothetical protein